MVGVGSRFSILFTFQKSLQETNLLWSTRTFVREENNIICWRYLVLKHCGGVTYNINLSERKKMLDIQDDLNLFMFYDNKQENEVVNMMHHDKFSETLLKALDLFQLRFVYLYLLLRIIKCTQN